MSIIEVFEKLICDDWLIERQNANWYVREQNLTSNPKLEIFGAKLLGFSLEKSGQTAWPFMHNLEHMHKVCDAIIVTEINNKSLVIAVELKSKNLCSATTQIRNAWLFMEWLRALLEHHGYWTKGWSFCGLISFTPRKQQRKGKTFREKEIEMSNRGKYPIAYIKNTSRLDLQTLYNSL